MKFKNRKDNNKKKWLIVGGSAFIVFSMVFSIFAIMVDNQDSSMTYNKHKFLTTDTGYKTKISGEYMEFSYYPSELERINLSADIMSKIKAGTGFAFVFNPNDNITENLKNIDLLRYDAELQFKNVYFAVSEKSANYPLTVVSCANATAQFPFIMINTNIKASDDTGFTVSSENPYCFIMNARLKELLASKDRFVYTYYDIMTPK